MSKSLKIFSLLILFSLIAASSSRGQGATDVLRYSLEYPSYDAASLVIPGVSNPSGFGSYQENPASMALFEESYVSFNLNSRIVEESTVYLGNPSSFDDSQINIGNFGFLYKVPTTRGSLVVGGGYSQSADYNRAFSGSGRNNSSTLTDFYASFPVDNPLNEAAFNAFAIDDIAVVNNGDTTFVSESVFRIGLSQYPGINQSFEVIEKGVLGDYSAFVATEFRKNIFFGASIGFLSGNYSYRRSFLESDKQNDYESAFIDSDGDGQADTDIDNILSEDTIDAELLGFTARLGVVVLPIEQIRIGVGYQFRNTLTIDEEFSTEITTRLDNGSEPFFGEDLGSFSYKVERPNRLNVGLTLRNIGGFTLTAGAERVSYSKGTIEFDSIRDRDDENQINETVSTSLEDVINIRGGIEYKANELFSARAGYAYYPSPQASIDATRQFYSGGFSARIFDDTILNLGVQYSVWEDQNQLYDYFSGNRLAAETVTEDVSRWNIIAGIQLLF